MAFCFLYAKRLYETAITDDRFMKIFAWKGSYFKYSPKSFDYVDTDIKTRSRNALDLFALTVASASTELGKYGEPNFTVMSAELQRVDERNRVILKSLPLFLSWENSKAILKRSEFVFLGTEEKKEQLVLRDIKFN